MLEDCINPFNIDKRARHFSLAFLCLDDSLPVACPLHPLLQDMPVAQPLSWDSFELFIEIFSTSLLHLPRGEDHPQQSDCRHPRKSWHHSEGLHSYCEGPRGTLRRDFNHINVELSLLGGLGAWRRGSRLTKSCERERNWPPFTLSSVTYRTDQGCYTGFCYKMRSVYAHLPINVVIEENGSLVKIGNFLGKNYVSRDQKKLGVVCSVSQTQKDELILEGNNSELIDSASHNNEKQGYQKIFKCYLCCWKRINSANWLIRSKLSSYRNSKMPNDFSHLLAIFLPYICVILKLQ